jgi:TonB family protein
MKGKRMRRQAAFFSVSLSIHLVAILVLVAVPIFLPDGSGVVVDRPLIVEMRVEEDRTEGTVGETRVGRLERTDEGSTVRAPAPPGESAEDRSGPPTVAGGAPVATPPRPPEVVGGGGGGDEALADYIALVRRMIQRHKYYPRDAYLRNDQGTVTVSFLLDSRGRLLDAGVFESSGHARLDEAAVGAVRSASPYPTFPDGLGRDTLGLRLSIKYEIR